MALGFKFIVLGAAVVVAAAGSVTPKSLQAQKEERLQRKKEAAEAEKKELAREAEEKKAAKEASFERGIQAVMMGKPSKKQPRSVSIEQDLESFQTAKKETAEDKVSESIHKDLKEVAKFEAETHGAISQADQALEHAEQRVSHAEAQSRIVGEQAKELQKVKLNKVKGPPVDHSVLKAMNKEMTPDEAAAALKEQKQYDETQKAFHYLKSRVKA